MSQIYHIRNRSLLDFTPEYTRQLYTAVATTPRGWVSKSDPKLSCKSADASQLTKALKRYDTFTGEEKQQLS